MDYFTPVVNAFNNTLGGSIFLYKYGLYFKMDPAFM